MLKLVLSRRFLVTLILSLLLISSGPLRMARAAPTTAPTAGDDLLRYLGWVIEWYRAVNSQDASTIDPRDIVYDDSVQADSRQALQLGFAYAHAQADLLGPDAGGLPATDSQSARAKRIAKAATDAAAHAAALQVELDSVNQQITDGSAATRPDLLARRDKIMAELNLAKARSDTIQRFSSMMGAQGGGMTLSEKIQDLERAIPDATPSPQSAATSPPANSTTATTPQPFHAETAGVFGLVTQMFSLSGRMRELDELANQTERLGSYTDKLREPIRTQLLSAIKRGDTLAATRESDSIATINSDRQQIDSLATRFKQLSAAAVPLGGQSVAMESARANLLQWHDSLNRQFKTALHYLIFRTGSMAAVILLVLGISSICAAPPSATSPTCADDDNSSSSGALSSGRSSSWCSSSDS